MLMFGDGLGLRQQGSGRAMPARSNMCHVADE
jgi:hypothetical protein